MVQNDDQGNDEPLARLPGDAFARVSVALLRSPEFQACTLSETRLLLVLLARMKYSGRGKGTWKIDRATLALDTGLSERAMEEASKRLKERGLISWESGKRVGPKQASNVYRVLTPPSLRPHEHVASTPHADVVCAPHEHVEIQEDVREEVDEPSIQGASDDDPLRLDVRARAIEAINAATDDATYVESIYKVWEQRRSGAFGSLMSWMLAVANRAKRERWEVFTDDEFAYWRSEAANLIGVAGAA